MGVAGASAAGEGRVRLATVRHASTGLIAALAVSIAAHAAFMFSRWAGVSPGSASTATSSWMTARLVPAAKPAEVAVDPTPLSIDSDSRPIATAPDRPNPVTLTDVRPAINDPLPANAVASPAPPAAAAVAPAASAPRLLPTETEPGNARLPTITATDGPSGADRGPQLLDDIDPEIPNAAGVRGGSVTVRVVISDRGVVESAEVVRSTPAGLFDSVTLAAVAKTRFAPALRNGLPVRETATYEITFAPVGRGTDASGRTY